MDIEKINIEIEHMDMDKESMPKIKNDAIFDEKILKLFELTIKEEQSWIFLLEKMMGEAKSKNNREILRQIRLDDQKHLKLLKEMYIKITGVAYNEIFSEVYENITYKNAMLLKIRSVEFYRQLYYLFLDIDMKDMLFEIITDQQNHSILFVGLDS